MLLQSGGPKRSYLCVQETLFWCLTGPMNAGRVEMEQWVLGWGQSPTESCPKDGKEMSRESHDMISLGNRVSQEQGNQVIFLLLSLVGREQEY